MTASASGNQRHRRPQKQHAVIGGRDLQGLDGVERHGLIMLFILGELHRPLADCRSAKAGRHR